MLNIKELQKYLLIIILSLFFIKESFSKEETQKDLDISKIIMGHVKDSHDFHIIDYKGHSISIPLPVILCTKDGLVCFSSSKFHHDDYAQNIVEVKGNKFVKYKEKIYYSSDSLNERGEYIKTDKTNKILNDKPLDLSITKNVFSMFMSVIILFIIFFSLSFTYKKVGISKSHKGMASFIEPIIVFMVDEVIKVNIGGKKYLKYVPFLLTVFFFILINNIIGIIPFFPFGSNLTGNISFTLVLATLTLLFTIFSGNKNYWSHIFATPGVPIILLPIMIPIEIIGIITKPFALMIRLFANITAGHIVILSLISLIFLLKTIFVSPASVIFVVFMNVLELLVAFIQAYIFTMLSAMFIGNAVEEGHH